MSSVSHSFANYLPITAKLNPLKRKNWPDLVQSAIITRLVIGAVRIAENHPNRNRTQEMTGAEKQKAFAERCFVELVGTLAVISLLHLGQDLAAKVLEKIYKPLVPDIRAKAIAQLKQNPSTKFSVEEFTQAYDEVIGTQTKGLVGRIVNLKKVPWTKTLVGANLRSLAKKLNMEFDSFHRHAPEALTKEYHFRANRMFNIAIMFGVLFSAVAGGYGIQWLNDTAISGFLKKRYPEKAPEGFLSLSPSSNNSSNPFAQFGGGTL